MFLYDFSHSIFLFSIPAIRSGDYYMFDDMDDEELDLIMEKTSEDTSPDEDLDKDQTISRVSKLTIVYFIY